MGKAEEYIKRNRIESMPGGHVCYIINIPCLKAWAFKYS